MAYEVLARKWRPQQFEDVVGQDHVTRTLKNAIESNRLAHAYLFVGPRGIGKTSVARIFAKALNCTKGPTATPCDKCDSCKEIMSGSNLDVMEIDGASNNTVDQIRDLRDTVKYLPTHGKFKIFIIDEVHMLTTSAFNALLKTLEEPPAHVKFIFATTEADKVLATIVSRCQRFDLRRIPMQLLVDRLRLIAKSEKIKVDDDALLAIARGAEGGLRDAESAFDQLISFKGNSIVEDDVLSVFGLASRGALEHLVEKLLTGEIKDVLATVAELDRAGKDLQRIVMELLVHFRNLLVYINAPELSDHEDMTDSQIEKLKKHAGMTDTTRVLRITDILSETEEKMRHTLSRRTLLELALIRCARGATVVTLEEILAKVKSLEASGALAGAQSAAPQAAVSYTAPSAEKKSPDIVAEAGISAEIDYPEPPPEELTPEQPESQPAVENKDLKLLKQHWAGIVSKISRTTPSTRGILKDARPLSVTDEVVTVGLDAEFEDEADKFDAARNRKAVELAIAAILGREVVVEFRLVEMEFDDAAAVQPEAKPADASEDQPKSRDELVSHPLVKKVQNMFDGRIVDIRM